MNWNYDRESGCLKHAGIIFGWGYSGAGIGKNNPAYEQVRNIGPLPKGKYRIVGPPENYPEHGPFVLRLEPLPETEMYGRSGILIHGDSIENPGTASKGCLVINRLVRNHIWEIASAPLAITNGDDILEAV